MFKVQTRIACPERERVVRTSPQVSLQLLNPSQWKWSRTVGFFRDENIIVLEARSILYAVRYAESCCPPTILRWCWRSAKDVQLFFHIAFSHASYLDVREGFVLSFKWIPSELNYFDNGNRFFDRDYDPSK